MLFTIYFLQLISQIFLGIDLVAVEGPSVGGDPGDACHVPVEAAVLRSGGSVSD